MREVLVHYEDNLWDLISTSLEDVIDKPVSIKIRSLRLEDFENKEWFDDEWTKEELQEILDRKEFVVFELKRD